ncbi:histidine--tRNA ligase [Luteitalea sp. TBR-22]|uniref:histidine--tRNA ligase n=1 Tax=Luteitalea sp. TBR-22 TaxID=2802971 RepID=UPI001AF76DA7|nr:histidine--tRNA ligase [Luteitalea sp. TBR-22]BCS33042.1 histidine--tRNA ligase [Luteitalea sp. TBR-22]
MASTAPARGMRDFLPADVRRRAYVIGVIRGVYERYGFEPLETPAVENIETLLGKYGEEGNQLIFKILKRGEHEASGQADLALRYDLTVPLSRVVAEHRGALPRYFKRFQIQPVWRADRPARGRFREFYQCDVDATGSTSPVVEAELCAAACEAMQALGFSDAVLRLNHRAVLAGVLDVAGVPADRHGDALVALDKLDKIGLDGVKAEYEQRGLAPALADTVLGILGAAAISGAVAADNEAALSRVEAFVAGHEAATAGIATMREVLSLAAHTPAAGQLRVDLSLARGLSYYTGCIMEMTVPDLAGSLGGGGRYDNLVGMFLGQQVPAAGFSLGLERILVVMGERGMFPAHIAATAADVLVAQWNASSAGEALALAHALRRHGLRVEVYPDADKLGKQFKYAASTGVPLVVIEGEDEKAAGELTVKDLRSGEQRRLPRADAGPLLRDLLTPASSGSL